MTSTPTLPPGARILLDGRSLQDRSAVRGIGTYLRGLLDGLATLGADSQVDLLLRRGSPEPADMGRWQARPGPRVAVTKRRLQPLLDPALVATVLRGRRWSVYHAIEYAQPLRSRVPVVVTVHDLIPFLYPDDYPWMRRERLLALRLLRHADAVITPSRATALDVARLAWVDQGRIVVVPHGVGREFAPADPARIEEMRTRLRLGDGPYLLAVGVFDPRKRLSLLLDVVRRVRANSPVRLVIAGEQGAYEAPVQRQVAAAGLADVTRVTGYADAADLPALYSGAGCLVFTSAYEGFGLPLLEAMACGTPVAAFANSAIPEVMGDAGVLVEDGDAAGMAEAVSALLGDPGHRTAVASRGREWAARHTWERTGTETLAVYRRMVPGP